MAHEAEAGDPEGSPEPDRTRLDWMLRVLESVMFCCLSALVLFWIADRMRGVNFDPIPVVPCVGEACTPYVGPHANSPWSIYSDALDPRGVVSFSGQNLCRQLVDTLETRGADAQGVDLILDRITSRGTVTVTPLDDGTLIVGPGARNDGFGDVLRDAFSLTASRGCHPINYAPVFWPLWAGWMLLANLRLFRNRQQVWAER